MFLIVTEGEGIIGLYDSRGDAERVIAEYEEADKAAGVYIENYYKIVEG